MAHTYKDKSPYKADRQPRLQKKARKDNYSQNLTANADMFMEDDTDLDDDSDQYEAYTESASED